MYHKKAENQNAPLENISSNCAQVFKSKDKPINTFFSVSLLSVTIAANADHCLNDIT